MHGQEVIQKFRLPQALIREKNANTVKRHTSKNNCRNRNR